MSKQIPATVDRLTPCTEKNRVSDSYVDPGLESKEFLPLATTYATDRVGVLEVILVFGG